MKKSNRRQFPAGGSLESVRRSGSEVALSANVQEDGALVLELIQSRRLRSGSSEVRAARHLLVEEERADFSRERQVLDGSPAGDHTNLSDVEVGVTAVGASSSRSRGLTRMGGCERSAVDTLSRRDARQIIVRSTIVLDLGVAAPEAGRPVGIPVVVERTTDTPSAGQDDAAATRTRSKRAGRSIEAIRGVAETNALIAAGKAGVTEHCEARRRTAGGDHGLGVTLGVRCVDLEIVARTGREVLDLQGNVHRTAPLVFGVTGDFRQSRRDACDAGRAGTEDVVGSVHEMPDSTNLEQTPSLVDTDVAGDIGSMHARVGVDASTGR